jgi:CheY-like chemotaxis protein
LIFLGAQVSLEILVVDDSAPLAEETAALIRVGARLETGFASDSATALGLVERHPIPVVVLDQRMGPDLSGTELFQRLRAVRPDVRAIMLTGEAGADEVGQALALGFHDYLPKGRIAELPGVVLLQHLKGRVADLEQRTEAENVLLWPRRRPWWRRRRGAEIRLISRRVVADRFVDPAGWVTVVQVNAGQEHRIASQVTRTSSIVVEEQSRRTLQANVGLKTRSLGEITSALQTVLGDMSRRTRTVDDSTTDSSDRPGRGGASLTPVRPVRWPLRQLLCVGSPFPGVVATGVRGNVLAIGTFGASLPRTHPRFTPRRRI